MFKVLALIIMMLATLLIGCAAPNPRLDDAAYKKLENREYTGVTKNQILDAMEELLRLADGDDFKIVRDDNMITAHRAWTEYYLLKMNNGVDSWQIKAIPIEGGFNANLLMIRTPGITYNMGNIASYPKDYRVKMNSTALYDLFWARMDYLLGKRHDWMTCKMSDERVTNKIVWGSTDPLCNVVNIKDDKPLSSL